MERIEMLISLNMIDEKDHLDLLKIIEIVESTCDVKVTEENGGIFITHVAALFQRNKNGTLIDPLGGDVISQLKSETHYRLAQKTVDLIASTIFNPISELERHYLVLHLCTLKNSDVSAKELLSNRVDVL